MLARLALFCFRRRRRVLALWVLAVVGVTAIAQGALGGDAFRTEFSLPDSESRQVIELLNAAAPGTGDTIDGQIVFRTTTDVADGVANVAVKAVMEGLFDKIRAAVPTVALDSPYDVNSRGLINADGTTAIASLAFPNGSEAEVVALATRIYSLGRDVAATNPATADALIVEFGGDPFVTFSLPESELIGILAAVVILVIAFGSILAMGLSVGTAVLGLIGGVGLITVGSHVMMMPDFSLQIGGMIGLGVGIDYALFIVTRYREQLHLHGDPERATVVAIDSAGRAVLFAGITVVISLLGMFLMGLKFIYGLAIAGSLSVAVMVAASLTLLPALLGFTGKKIDQTSRAALIGLIAFAVISLFGVVVLHDPRLVGVGLVVAVLIALLSLAIKPLRTPIHHRPPKPREQSGWYRWSRLLQRHPWSAFVAGGGALVLLGLPVFSLRLGFSDHGNRSEAQTARRAYDLVADGFGPGYSGPLLLAVGNLDPAFATALTEGTVSQQLGALTSTLQQTPGVAFASPAIPVDSSTVIWRVIPSSSPQSPDTAQLVDRLRTEILPPVNRASNSQVMVGGFTASSIDLSDSLGGRLPIFISAVLLLSFILLMVVFRSLLVPLKAVIMNLLSIGAAYGILVAVFQWGWGASLIGVGSKGPIEPFIPMMLFAIVFGLSMDYEVFLLSRMKEEFDRTGDNAAAVADGLAATARVITAAAVIMVCVFASFIAGDDRVIKLFGLGLAVAVLIDATIVRMVLVPATMELLGARNWWIPAWLDRLLPRVHVEGHLTDDELVATGRTIPAASTSVGH